MTGKGKQKYLYDDMMTATKKIAVYHVPANIQKSGVTFKRSDAFMHQVTDNEAAEQLNTTQNHLFKKLHERLKITA